MWVSRFWVIEVLRRSRLRLYREKVRMLEEKAARNGGLFA
jgi:hypothetical protein